MSTATLGEFLRNEREKRGITIEQVASATKISTKILRTLESDTFAELPARPFVRGFVISYARFIGLEPNEVANRFDSFIEKKSSERPDRAGGHSGYAFEVKSTESTRALLWAAISVFVIAAGIGATIYKKGLLKGKAPQKIEQLRAGVTPTPQPTAPVSRTEPHAAPIPIASPLPSLELPIAMPVPTPSPIAQDPLKKGDLLKPEEVKYKVVIKAQADVWVRYQVDSHPTMALILKKEKMIVLKATDAILAQVSNPKAAVVRHKTTDYIPLEDMPSYREEKNGYSFSVPPELSEKTTEFFKFQSKLPETPDPE